MVIYLLSNDYDFFIKKAAKGGKRTNKSLLIANFLDEHKCHNEQISPWIRVTSTVFDHLTFSVFPTAVDTLNHNHRHLSPWPWVDTPLRALRMVGVWPFSSSFFISQSSSYTPTYYSHWRWQCCTLQLLKAYIRCIICFGFVATSVKNTTNGEHTGHWSILSDKGSISYYHSRTQP